MFFVVVDYPSSKLPACFLATTLSFIIEFDFLFWTAIRILVHMAAGFLNKPATHCHEIMKSRIFLTFPTIKQGSTEG